MDGQMVQSVNGEPMFSRNNYGMLKIRMKAYLSSIGCDVWHLVINGYTPPKKVKTASQKESKKNNSMEMEAILDLLLDSIK